MSGLLPLEIIQEPYSMVYPSWVVAPTSQKKIRIGKESQIDMKNVTKGHSVFKENESLHLQDWFSRCLLSALLIQSRIAGTSEKKK
jgi:hypothetical protein